jgi:hypothetical protein
MAEPASRFRSRYGAGPLHLFLMLGALALAVYAVLELGLADLVDPDSWWQSVAVWFLAAALAHDLLVVPVYAIVDRLITTSAGRVEPPRRPRFVNHLRVPLLASALTFVVFVPGIVQQGTDAHLRATGLTQDPYLGRWLVLSASFFLVSLLWFLVRQAVLRARGPSHG